MKSPSLFIILVNWNKPKLTLGCIDSIKKSSYDSYRIVVVDNGSTDNSLELLHENSGDYHLITSGLNLGYTGGNNLGINYALDNKAEFIFLLNNDTLVQIDTLDKLISGFLVRAEIGIVQPKIYFYPDKDIIWSGPTGLNEFLLRPKLIGYGEFGENICNDEVILPYAVGCATLIKREVFLKIGALDDDFFAVCEDVDFGIRARKAGFKILYVPNSVVYHLESASSGGLENPNYIHLQTRAFLLFLKKHSGSNFHFYIVFTVFLMSSFMRVLRLLYRGNYLGIRAIFLSYRNFILGNGKEIIKII